MTTIASPAASERQGQACQAGAAAGAKGSRSGSGSAMTGLSSCFRARFCARQSSTRWRSDGQALRKASISAWRAGASKPSA